MSIQQPKLVLPGEIPAPPIVEVLPQVEVPIPGAGTPTSGLTPGLVSSTEPSGIVLPALPGSCSPADGVLASGSEAAVPVVLQLLATAEPSELPPPSKLLPVVLLPMPEPIEVAPPSKTPVLAVVPTAHGVTHGSGLVPPVSSSVDPSGMPTGPDDALKFIVPSGEVAPMPGVGAVCADAALVAAIATSAANAKSARIDILGSNRAAAEVGRGDAGHLAKRHGERARRAEAEHDADLRHRHVAVRQQRLGALDAAMTVESMRRHAERPLEGAGEVVGAQTHQPRQRRERHLLGEPLVDVPHHGLLLPGREPAANALLGTARATGGTREIVRQNDAERLAIAAIVRPRSLDGGLELQRRLPHLRILEEQPRRERGLGLERKRTRIEIEERQPRKDARLLPVDIFVAGRDEDELALVLAQRGARQTFDEGETIGAGAGFEQHEHVDGSAKAEFDASVPGDADRLDRHAAPGGATADHTVRRQHRDRRLDRLESVRQQAVAIRIRLVVEPAERRPSGRERRGDRQRHRSIDGRAREIMGGEGFHMLFPEAIRS